MPISQIEMGQLVSSKQFSALRPLLLPRVSGSDLNSDLIQKLVSQFNLRDGEIDRANFSNDELLQLHVQVNWLQHALMEAFATPHEGFGEDDAWSMSLLQS